MLNHLLADTMRIKTKHWVSMLCIALVCTAALFVQGWRHGWEEMRKMDCQCNIKQIMVILNMYAEENDGWFPNRDGEAGLDMLRKAMWEEAYLMNVPYLLNCPSVQPALEQAISYDYRAGYRMDSDRDIGIVMDKAGNHREFGNIGFVDGRVLSFPGKDWQENAGR